MTDNVMATLTVFLFVSDVNKILYVILLYHSSLVSFIRTITAVFIHVCVDS